jgi:hypothetical protein
MSTLRKVIEALEMVERIGKLPKVPLVEEFEEEHLSIILSFCVLKIESYLEEKPLAAKNCPVVERLNKEECRLWGRYLETVEIFPMHLSKIFSYSVWKIKGLLEGQEEGEVYESDAATFFGDIMSRLGLVQCGISDGRIAWKLPDSCKSYRSNQCSGGCVAKEG